MSMTVEPNNAQRRDVRLSDGTPLPYCLALHGRPAEFAIRNKLNATECMELIAILCDVHKKAFWMGAESGISDNRRSYDADAEAILEKVKERFPGQWTIAFDMHIPAWRVQRLDEEYILSIQDTKRGDPSTLLWDIQNGYTATKVQEAQPPERSVTA